MNRKYSSLVLACCTFIVSIYSDVIDLSPWQDVVWCSGLSALYPIVIIASVRLSGLSLLGIGVARKSIVNNIFIILVFRYFIATFLFPRSFDSISSINALNFLVVSLYSSVCAASFTFSAIIASILSKTCL